MESLNLTQNNGIQCKVIKQSGFTVISNILLRNKSLSFKAKGLLVNCLSLPPNWDYSINGLTKLAKDGKESVTSALKELQEYGFLHIEKTNKGTFKSFYIFYESPNLNPYFNAEKEESPKTKGSTESGFPYRVSRVEFSESENPQQLNTNNKILKSNTKNKNINNELKNCFGEFGNVFFTQKEQEKLLTLYGNKFSEAVEVLSSYKASKDKKYKSDYAVLCEHNWVFKKIFPNGKPQNSKSLRDSKYAKCYETGT